MSPVNSDQSFDISASDFEPDSLTPADEALLKSQLGPLWNDLLPDIGISAYERAQSRPSFTVLKWKCENRVCAAGCLNGCKIDDETRRINLCKWIDAKKVVGPIAQDEKPDESDPWTGIRAELGTKFGKKDVVQKYFGLYRNNKELEGKYGIISELDVFVSKFEEFLDLTNSDSNNAQSDEKAQL